MDILFDDEPEPIKSAVTLLLGAGYVPSAKHPFQLLKKLPVAGQPFIFNIDLMHPAESELERDMFHDILDLGIKDDYDSHITHIIKSICFPSARIIFDEGLWSSFDFGATLPEGTKASDTVPLMDERGLILSKCQSVSNKKRARDAFDIYFVLSGPNGGPAAAQLKELAEKFPQVATQLAELKKFLVDSPDKFNERVQEYAGTTTMNYASLVQDWLFRR